MRQSGTLSVSLARATKEQLEEALYKAKQSKALCETQGLLLHTWDNEIERLLDALVSRCSAK